MVCFFLGFDYVTKNDDSLSLSTYAHMHAHCGHKYSKNVEHFGACHIASCVFLVVDLLTFFICFAFFELLSLLYRYCIFSPFVFSSLFFFSVVVVSNIHRFFISFTKSELNAHNRLSDLEYFFFYFSWSCRSHFNGTSLNRFSSEESLK